MTTDEDEVDRTALERMWPCTKYGAPYPESWFHYVGRTWKQRNALTPLRVHRGPRGSIRLKGGAYRGRSTFSGEFTTSD